MTYSCGGRTRRASYPGGSVICAGADPVVWSAVREPTEAVELYRHEQLPARYASGADTGLCWPVERSIVGGVDPVVVGIASIFWRGPVGSAIPRPAPLLTLRSRLFEQAGFNYARSKGKKSCVMCKTVPPVA